MKPRTRTLVRPDGQAVEIPVRRNDGIRKRCSCARRAWATCSHDWFFNFKFNGQVYRFRLDKYADHPITTRADALKERDRLRGLIRAGNFPPVAPTPAPVTTPAALAFDAFAQQWRASRQQVTKGQRANDRAIVTKFSALPGPSGLTLGQTPIGLLTLNVWVAAFGLLGTLAGSTFNKYRQCLLALQEWGVDNGHLPKPWVTGKVLRKGGALARRKGARRDRRLIPDVLDAKGQVQHPGEERRLLAAASPWLWRLIVAALETGARLGELLKLTWADVDLARAEITFRAETTKTRTMRQIVISPKLLGILTHLQRDPAGKAYPPEAFVFGTVTGAQVKDPKKAWQACCRQAGVTDLQFRDLRHEAGSRLLEKGYALHDVAEVLGHENVATTSTYLNSGIHRLHDLMRRFGTGDPLHVVAPDPDSAPQPLGNEPTDSDGNPLVN